VPLQIKNFTIRSEFVWSENDSFGLQLAIMTGILENNISFVAWTRSLDAFAFRIMPANCPNLKSACQILFLTVYMFTSSGKSTAMHI
jgi:hypothetical protein